jgi:FxsC-like protein
MPSYWFFLSYARLDRDEYLKRFYKDLTSQVRSLGGLDEEDIGFFDGEDIEPGEAWPHRLAESLQTSRTFVSVYSPTYFTREYCGKEWQVFRSRLDAYVAASGAQLPALIIPVLWVPLDSLPKALPDAISDVQYTHDAFGDVYTTEGLRQLMALKKYSDDYKTFLRRFAQKLIEIANQYSLPPLLNLKPIKEIESAFHTQNQRVPAFPQRSENVGPGYVQFVFVAGRRDELRTLRQKLDFYGDEGGLDWRPYLPEVIEDVGIIAQEIAWRERLHYEVIPLDANIIQQLQKATQNNKLVVIVVDTWTLRVERYHELMQAYDGHNALNCILVVLWNITDDETVNNISILNDTILYTFPFKATSKDPNTFLDRISSLEELKRELTPSLNKARMRIISIAKVVRKMEGYQVIPKPTITVS